METKTITLKLSTYAEMKFENETNGFGGLKGIEFDESSYADDFIEYAKKIAQKYNTTATFSENNTTATIIKQA